MEPDQTIEFNPLGFDCDDDNGDDEFILRLFAWFALYVLFDLFVMFVKFTLFDFMYASGS